jgi:cell division septation protein DedD
MARGKRGGDKDTSEGFEIDQDDTFEVEGPDEDRLPWLEAVEEEDERQGPSALKLIASVVIGLVAIALIVGGLFWLGNRNREGGNGEVIAAPEGDYKVRPDNPGGMNVQGTGDTAYAASEGAQPQAQLNPGAVPEAPVARAPASAPAANSAASAAPPQHPTPAPAPTPTPAAAAPAPAQAQAAAGGGSIQLGAFSSQASANRAWTGLSGRFRYLAPLSHSVIPVQSGGRTLYRLRASGPGAADVCRRLQIAGEACSVVG